MWEAEDVVLQTDEQYAYDTVSDTGCGAVSSTGDGCAAAEGAVLQYKGEQYKGAW